MLEGDTTVRLTCYSIASGRLREGKSGRGSPTSLHSACQLQCIMQSLDPPSQNSRRNTPANCTDVSLANSERPAIHVSNPLTPGEIKATQYQTIVQATGQFSLRHNLLQYRGNGMSQLSVYFGKLPSVFAMPNSNSKSFGRTYALNAITIVSIWSPGVADG